MSFCIWLYVGNLLELEVKFWWVCFIWALWCSKYEYGFAVSWVWRRWEALTACAFLVPAPKEQNDRVRPLHPVVFAGLLFSKLPMRKPSWCLNLTIDVFSAFVLSSIFYDGHYTLFCQLNLQNWATAGICFEMLMSTKVVEVSWNPIASIVGFWQQILHDMRMCWLLEHSASSTGYSLKYSSCCAPWENEAGHSAPPSYQLPFFEKEMMALLNLDWNWSVLSPFLKIVGLESWKHK